MASPPSAQPVVPIVRPSPEAHLRRRVDAKIGAEFGGADKLIAAGITNWCLLGSVSPLRWQAFLSTLDCKRLWVREDLYDTTRFGPGHLNSFDMLRAEAVRDHYIRSTIIRDHMMMWPSRWPQMQSPTREGLESLQFRPPTRGALENNRARPY